MHIINWLFSIEHRVVFFIGSIDLENIYYAVQGFLEAQRFINNDKVNPFFPGFQDYVENYYSVAGQAAKSWDILITERTNSPEQALDTFYELLHKYHDLG